MLCIYKYAIVAAKCKHITLGCVLLSWVLVIICRSTQCTNSMKSMQRSITTVSGSQCSIKHNLIYMISTRKRLDNDMQSLLVI